MPSCRVQLLSKSILAHLTKSESLAPAGRFTEEVADERHVLHTRGARSAEPHRAHPIAKQKSRRRDEKERLGWPFLGEANRLLRGYRVACDGAGAGFQRNGNKGRFAGEVYGGPRRAGDADGGPTNNAAPRTSAESSRH